MHRRKISEAVRSAMRSWGVGMVHLQTTEQQKLPANPQKPEEAREGFVTGLGEYVWPCWHLDFRLLASRTMRRYISVILCHPVCEASFQFSRSVMSDSFRLHGLQHARLPVHHHLPESTQTHVHGVSDAIQPPHPLLSPSSPTFNLSQHQDLIKWVSSSHQVAKVLEFQLQHQSFQWTPRTDLLYGGLVGSPCSPRGSQESSPTPQFKSINSSALSFLYSPTFTSICD